MDIDHLTSMCVQLPKQETVKTAESKITTVIYLKHTLELVEPLRMALKDTEADLFKAYYEVKFRPTFRGKVIKKSANESRLVLKRQSGSKRFCSITF